MIKENMLSVGGRIILKHKKETVYIRMMDRLHRRVIVSYYYSPQSTWTVKYSDIEGFEEQTIKKQKIVSNPVYNHNTDCHTEKQIAILKELNLEHLIKH